MKEIKIFDQMGDYVASSHSPVVIGTMLGTCFGGCGYLPLKHDPIDGVPVKVAKEIEKWRKKTRSDIFEAEYLKGIILASVTVPTDTYEHSAKIDEHGLHLSLGRSYGLVSGWESFFQSRIGTAFHLVIVTESHIHLVWKTKTGYGEYSVLKENN